MSEPLHHEPLYPRLNWNWSWRGITLSHLSVGPLTLMGLWPVTWVIQETIWQGCPTSVSVVIAASVGLFVGLIQFRRDPLYLQRQIQRALMPRHLSPFRPTSGERPFPVSAQEL